jgi:hypothetical protein
MAAEDLADMKDDTNTYKTAQESVADFGPLASDEQNAAAAAAAGVKDASMIDYDVALDAYAARPDIESLARRRARDFPETFADAAFMRASVEPGSSSAVTS